ncbi:uncharacterized protein LOC111695286 [Eurytemora carolleeae]|uniref:uncharacterized protein LOC111695286 n=1 Tax=Eurytemora carolleeae TaxID=1294199 RepID=UPI000C75904D|nr:uncharacterized protein LOC111695286 [Eurytemora carolleeae]|eukprot:XP_023320311.1 uncharacterized protein LOC111695286 [Eurytemora affinis]
MPGRMLGPGLWFVFLAGFLLADAQGHIQGHQPARDVPRNGGGVPAYLPKLEAVHNLDVTPMNTKEKQPYYKMRLRLHKRDVVELQAEKRRYTPPLESLKEELAQPLQIKGGSREGQELNSIRPFFQRYNTMKNDHDEMMIIEKRVVMPAFWKIMEEIKSNNEKRVVMPAFWKIMKEIKSNNEERVVMPVFWKIMKEIKSNNEKRVVMPAFWKIMKEIKSNNEKRVVMPAFWKIMKEIKSNNEKRVVMPAFWKIMEEIKSNTKDENGLHVTKRIFMPTIWKMMEQMQRESMDEDGYVTKGLFAPGVWKLMEKMQKDTKSDDAVHVIKRVFMPAIWKMMEEMQKNKQGDSEINVSKRRWTLPLHWKRLKEMRLKKKEQQNHEENIQGKGYFDLMTEKRAYMPPMHAFWNMMQLNNPKAPGYFDLRTEKRAYMPVFWKMLESIKSNNKEDDFTDSDADDYSQDVFIYFLYEALTCHPRFFVPSSPLYTSQPGSQIETLEMITTPSQGATLAPS